MDILPRTFEQMALRPTRYEVELVAGGKNRIIGYTARKTREALLRYVDQHRNEIVKHIDDPDVAWFSECNANCVCVNDAVSVRFTGRTERDARSAIDRNKVAA